MSYVATGVCTIADRFYLPGQLVDLSGFTSVEIEDLVAELGLAVDPASTGPAGLAGVNGVDGAPGETGLPGPAGPAGPIGPVGPAFFEPKGAWDAAAVYDAGDVVTHDGSSFYATGTPAVGATPGSDVPGWGYLAVQGAQGPQGPQGVPGDTGLTGAQGPAGAQGAPGVIGLVGPAGPKGDTGAQGPQGVPGPAGGSAGEAYSAAAAHTTGTRAAGTTYTNGTQRRMVQAAFRISATTGGSVRLHWKARQAGSALITNQEFGYTETASLRTAAVTFFVDPGGTYRIDTEIVLGGTATQVSWVETDS